MKMKQKKKSRFPDILSCTLGSSLLGSMLAGKRVIRGCDGVIPVGEGVIRAGQDF